MPETGAGIETDIVGLRRCYPVPTPWLPLSVAPSPSPGSAAPGTKVECEGADTVVTENMELKVFQKLELKVGAGLAVTYKKTMALKCGGNPVVAERVKENSNVR